MTSLPACGCASAGRFLTRLGSGVLILVALLGLWMLIAPLTSRGTQPLDGNIDEVAERFNIVGERLALTPQMTRDRCFDVGLIDRCNYWINRKFRASAENDGLSNSKVLHAFNILVAASVEVLQDELAEIISVTIALFVPAASVRERTEVADTLTRRVLQTLSSTRSTELESGQRDSNA
jgi:hypothetical protein